MSAHRTQIKNNGMTVDQAYQVLENNLPSFERRPEQIDLTRFIVSSLKYEQHGIAQAPTGTGKSFAVGLGLVPVLEGNEHRAIIATANNNLLEQYATKDLPFLQSMFPWLTWARAKGKGNYACIEKIERVFGQQVIAEDPTGASVKLRNWTNETLTGDREEINFTVKESDWAKVNADDSCTGRKCPFYEDCHYYKAKWKTERSRIIITNFDLALLDLFNPMAQILPSYKYIIFDEAHQLEDKALSKLEESLSELGIQQSLMEGKNKFKVSDPVFQLSYSATVDLFKAYRDLLSGGDRVRVQSSTQLVELTNKLLESLRNFYFAVSGYMSNDDREEKSKKVLLERIEKIQSTAVNALQSKEGIVTWAELGRRKNVKVVSSPLFAGKTLKHFLFNRDSKTVICMSATVGSRKKVTASKATPGFLKNTKPKVPAPLFKEFRKRIGMLNAGEFDCPSPFNYQKNCVIYTPKPPKEAENPNDPKWRAWMKEEIISLVELSQGRAFVLCTSSKMCCEIGEYIAQATRFPVTIQNGQTGKSKMIEWFKQTPNAVLVGTASFWEGVSIEGDALKLVIIDRIPFIPHTDPLQKAREDFYKSREDLKRRYFQELMLWPAKVKLQQGFGRLIRTKTDTGAVAILDPRLHTKNYGQAILRSLPPAPVVESIDDPRLITILGV